jgi:ornithine decarboxylase
MTLWRDNLPNVTPYYAIKTNNDPVITATLANLGAGFDCASQNEIEFVLNLGIDPTRIIFAHPRKPASAIDYAKEKGIALMTFDSIEEMNKLLTIYPEANFLLRIKTDDAESSSPLSQKFGASLEESYNILDEAFLKNANVVGIAFHVGSGCTRKETYLKALLDAASLFRYSELIWCKKLSVLDLGGGWSGTDDASFITIAKMVREILATYFPEVQYIAEPGRFFAAGTTTLVMKVLGKKHLENKFAYYVSNGVFGFFIASLYYNYEPEKILKEGWVFTHLSSRDLTAPLHPSLLWGPTCDSGDKIIDGILLPEMETGDYLAVENMGAYTYSLETSFNGIPFSRPYYLESRQLPKIVH